MINLCLAHMSDEGLEMKYVKEAFDSNWVAPLGSNVDAFEDSLKTFMNSGLPESESREVVALSSGTAAAHLALLGCGVGPGDEVCVQSFTFCASSNPVKYLGATPVFIDSEPVTWNMDPDLLEAAIIDRKAKKGVYPKAIVVVTLYGMPYRVDRILSIADKYGIPLIEDAAEGMGSSFNGRRLGTFGRFGILSFNGNKMITTSGGGAIICENQKLKEEMMWYATQARDSYPYYHHTSIGYNYRLSNVCAGIGRGQMSVVDAHISHHRHVQEMYEELLSDIPGIHVHSQPVDGGYASNFWLCTFTLDEDLRIKGEELAYREKVTSAVGGAAGVTRMSDSCETDLQPNRNVEALRLYMLSRKVEVRPLWKPMHRQPVYDGSPAYLNGISESVFKKGMCLPSGPCVSDEDVRYLVECIRESISMN